MGKKKSFTEIGSTLRRIQNKRSLSPFQNITGSRYSLSKIV
jgi:hypothetical protein